MEGYMEERQVIGKSWPRTTDVDSYNIRSRLRYENKKNNVPLNKSTLQILYWNLNWRCCCCCEETVTRSLHTVQRTQNDSCHGHDHQMLACCSHRDRWFMDCEMYFHVFMRYPPPPPPPHFTPRAESQNLLNTVFIVLFLSLSLFDVSGHSDFNCKIIQFDVFTFTILSIYYDFTVTTNYLMG